MNKAKSKKRLQTKFLSFKGAFVHFKAEKYEAKGDKRLMLFLSLGSLKSTLTILLHIMESQQKTF
jgi:hypothetical protein